MSPLEALQSYPDRFTRREREVIRLRWVEGLSYVQIAVELEPEVSIRTVGYILSAIRKKINKLIIINH